MEETSCWVYPMNGPHFLRKPWKTYKSSVSFIISDIIKAMDERDGYKTKGILREKSQDTDDLQAERLRQIDSGELRKYPETDSPLLIASIFKQYIKGVCEVDPLFTNEQIMPLTNHLISGNHESVTNTLKQMDESKTITISFIFAFLKKITMSEESCMTSSNIGTCCSPVLFPLSDQVSVFAAAKLIEMLLDNFDKIFKKEWYSESRILSDEAIRMLSMPVIDLDDIRVEAERRAIRVSSKIPVDYEYIDSLLGLKYPDTTTV